MKHWLVIIICLLSVTTFAQKKNFYRKEFSVIIENDAFLLKLKDGYYTNGAFLQFSKAEEKNNHKIIHRFELGQTMYTTRDRRAVLRGLETIDRPYAGYFYGKYSRDKFYTPHQLFSYSIGLGATGKWSMAEQLQEWYHRVIGLYFYPYWETQIPNAIGADATIKYVGTIAPDGAAKNLFKIVPTAQATVGNFFINAKVGAYFCFGAFEKNESSVLLNARVSKTQPSTKRKYELIFYFYPQLVAQAYNVTIQGNMFSKPTDSRVFTSLPEAIVYQQIFGAAYAKERWTTRFEIAYQSKEATSQRNAQRYGSLQLCYRFN